MTVFMKKLRDGQSIEQLREETHDLIQKNKGNILNVEERLQQQTKDLAEKIEDLQK